MTYSQNPETKEVYRKLLDTTSQRNVMSAEEFAEEILKLWEDPNTPDGGSPALYIAAQKEDIESIKLLIEGGVDPNQKGDYGCTALHIAALKEKIKSIKALIEAGADPDQKDNYGYTALHNAAIIGNPSCVQLLLDNGADPNIQDNNGRTPLHDAIQQELGDVIRLLLDRGADPNIVDKEGKTPKNLIETKVREGTLEESLLRIIERRERGLQQQQRLSDAISKFNSDIERYPGCNIQ